MDGADLAHPRDPEDRWRAGLPCAAADALTGAPLRPRPLLRPPLLLLRLRDRGAEERPVGAVCGCGIAGVGAGSQGRSGAGDDRHALLRWRDPFAPRPDRAGAPDRWTPAGVARDDP